MHTTATGAHQEACYRRRLGRHGTADEPSQHHDKGSVCIQAAVIQDIPAGPPYYHMAISQQTIKSKPSKAIVYQCVVAVVKT